MAALGWLIALAVLLAVEIMTMGLTTIWFAAGTLIAFVAALLHAPLWMQFILFALISIVMLIFTRPVALRYFNKSRERTNYESVPGKEGKVIERISNFQGSGVVIVSGQEWSARALHDDDVIEAGEKVVVREIRGVKVIVEKVKE